MRSVLKVLAVLAVLILLLALLGSVGSVGSYELLVIALVLAALTIWLLLHRRRSRGTTS